MTQRADLNIARAGEFFMYCLWLQGQMADLLIFRLHPEWIGPFAAMPAKVPQHVVTLRAEYWSKDFGPVRQEFEKQFRDLMSDNDRDDLKAIYHLRNAIAHCHVSIGRDYLLYRPARGAKVEQEIANTLGLKPVPDQANPTMMTMRLYRDAEYLHEFGRIQRLDEQCFKVIAAALGVPHGRIR